MFDATALQPFVLIVVCLSFSMIMPSHAFSRSCVDIASSQSQLLSKKKRQVFVEGIRPIETRSVREEMLEAFGRYGTVTDMAIHGMEKVSRRRRPYAFVTFAEERSVQSAVADNSSNDDAVPKEVHNNNANDDKKKQPRQQPLYKSVRPLFDKGDTWRRRETPVKMQLNPNTANLKVVDSLVNGALDIDVVLQVNKSHLSRVAEYLNVISNGGAEAVSTIESTGSRSASLILVRMKSIATLSTKQFVEECLGNDKYVHKALNKAYIVTPPSPPNSLSQISSGVNEGNSNIIQGFESDIITAACQQLKTLMSYHDANNKGKVVLKMEVFPPKKQRSILTALEEAIFEDKKITNVDIAPTGFTHVLSIVRINLHAPSSTAKTKEEKMEEQGTYLIGISEAPSVATLIGDGQKKEMEDDDVCRAYYKLDEAFGRYGEGTDMDIDASDRAQAKRELNTFLLRGSSEHQHEEEQRSLVALDCGAAPGGWTKYLLEQTLCAEVFSVDPGELSPVVLGLPGVNHLRMMIVEDALPLLKKKKVKVDVWVSDMCLHEISKQVDCLLASQQAGCLNSERSSTLFVITLKCNLGHSKGAHDEQVKREVDRLKGIAYGVAVTHLFSNRRGERTVVGFLKSI